MNCSRTALKDIIFKGIHHVLTSLSNSQHCTEDRCIELNVTVLSLPHSIGLHWMYIPLIPFSFCNKWSWWIALNMIPLRCRRGLCCRQVASVLDISASPRQSQFWAVNISIQTQQICEGWSFNGNHLGNNAFTAPWPIDKSIWICHDRDYFIFCITNCNPNIKFTTFTSNDLLAHLCKCLEMQQVMTHHRCSEIIKADFDLAHTLLHKGNKSSDSHFSENVHQIGCRML